MRYDSSLSTGLSKMSFNEINLIDDSLSCPSGCDGKFPSLFASTLEWSAVSVERGTPLSSEDEGR